jgi:hypothetical protein
MATDVTELAELKEEVQRLKDFIVGELAPEIARFKERKSFLLYSLRHPGIELREPLAVLVEQDGEQVIAVCYDLDVFGYGDTENEALDDLRRTVADLYFELKEHPEELGPLPELVWAYLSRIIAEGSQNLGKSIRNSSHL